MTSYFSDFAINALAKLRKTSQYFLKFSQKGEFTREKNTFAIKKNQREILRAAKTESNLILKPVLLNGGSIEHYYHFLFDLLLPLSKLIKKSSPKTVFLVEEFGPLTAQILKIYPDRLQIIKEIDHQNYIKSANLIGMNPRSSFLAPRSLTHLKRDICLNLHIQVAEKPNQVLLIERLPPEEYFISQAKIKGGGASRRSIKNHDELRNLLESIVNPNLKFSNLQLEKMPLEKQIQLFDQAKLVIAQHGAALANCIWMRPKGIVIELGENCKNNHFEIISDLCRLKYFRYQTNANHATLDLGDFANWLLNQSALRPYFKHIL